MSTPTGFRGRALLALLLLVPAPSIGVIAAMYAAEGALGQAVFIASKAWLLGFPLVWHVLVDRERVQIPRPRREGMGMGVLTGVLIFGAIAAGYLLVGRRWIDQDFVRQRVIEVGLVSPLVYVVGAIYWCTVNSLLEEYVWRWFVFTRCERLLPETTTAKAAAVVLAGLFFTLHHTLALNVYFGWQMNLLASLGVFVGGATWSWLYLRYRNLYAAWISHVLADVIIFAIGYHIVFGG